MVWIECVCWSRQLIFNCASLYYCIQLDNGYGSDRAGIPIFDTRTPSGPLPSTGDDFEWQEKCCRLYTSAKAIMRPKIMIVQKHPSYTARHFQYRLGKESSVAILLDKICYHIYGSWFGPIQKIYFQNLMVPFVSVLHSLRHVFLL